MKKIILLMFSIFIVSSFQVCFADGMTVKPGINTNDQNFSTNPDGSVTGGFNGNHKPTGGGDKDSSSSGHKPGPSKPNKPSNKPSKPSNSLNENINGAINAIHDMINSGHDQSTVEVIIPDINQDVWVDYAGKQDDVIRFNRVLEYHWDYNNLTCPSVNGNYPRQITPTRKTTQVFKHTGKWRVISNAWCLYDVGYIETYTVTHHHSDGSSSTSTRTRFVKTGETQKYEPSLKKVFEFTIDVKDLGKPVELPPKEEKQVEAIDELVE